ncbi:hypothetical protein HMF7854_00360 [Sphingomonas ginkgonis]|uniref:Uncharacterized protein n=1 Tax=Sphingomonas ginkgonis TaxID=2315330 RepID=A0A3R9Z4A0_9SPHN|nr:hypothetical protein [Sphingomonas ginkgonis]RST29452.1 hypothetical protein HMF7854_00360 [Sphingomonas ginkgonis]
MTVPTALPDATPVIPVVCDRCRAEGFAGKDRFGEIRDLLSFEPVPRRAHADGWRPEHQRAFIAALAITGSPRRAARTAGRHANGAEQLRNARGAAAFARAWDEALALYRERELLRLKDNLDALAGQVEQERAAAHADGMDRGAAPWSRPAAAGRPAAPDPDFPLADDPRGIFVATLNAYWIKLREEREARLDGRIAEADFALRQLTWIEVAADISMPDEVERWIEARRAGTPAIAAAATVLSLAFADARARFWAEAGAPHRPVPVPHRLLVWRDGGIALEADDRYCSGGAESLEQHAARCTAEQAEAARRQAAWELGLLDTEDAALPDGFEILEAPAPADPPTPDGPPAPAVPTPANDEDRP